MKKGKKKKIAVSKKTSQGPFGKLFLIVGLYTVFVFFISYIVIRLFNPTTNSSVNNGPNNSENYEDRRIPASLPSENVILHGDRNVRKIALTFDAEMTKGMRSAYLLKTNPSSYDRRIIETLTKTNTKATLFLTGMWMELYPSETRILAKNPLFEFGSHSYADTSFNGQCYGLEQMTLQQKIQDLGITEKLLGDLTERDNNLFRFPGGCYSNDDVKLVNDAGDTIVHWDVAGNDGFNNNTNQIVENVIKNIQNGSIIVLHMNGAPTAPKTYEALPMIIEKVKASGYEFVKVSELLNL